MQGYKDTAQGNSRSKLAGLVAALCLPVMAQEPPAEDTQPQDNGNYEAYAAYRADIDADLGDVLRAGCEPTLAQMSALMGQSNR